MNIDERLEALTVTVENLAGLAKDLLERQSQHEEWVEKADRQIEFLLVNQAKHEARLEQFADQAEADRQQAEADRQEVRRAVETMLKIAEAMQANVITLTQAQQGTSQRVANLERHLDAL